MSYINKRKTIGLISNEWHGIETCKVDDIISFIENIPEEQEIHNLEQKIHELRILCESWKSKAEELIPFIEAYKNFAEKACFKTNI